MKEVEGCEGFIVSVCEAGAPQRLWRWSVSVLVKSKLKLEEVGGGLEALNAPTASGLTR